MTPLALLTAAAVAVSASAAAPIRVACVGDSITAGYLASNASMKYPARLQVKLDAKFGNGSYIVSNFGAGGATVQKGADSPYWNRTQFGQWVNGTYDIVIMMLGTNDAKMPDPECIARWGPGSKMCASNWPLACSAPGATAATCTLVADFLSLITLAGTLGTNGKTPLRTIMTPPPLWKDGAYGMNESVLNDIMPSLVPTIAKAAGLEPPIDIFTALGGVKDWKSTYPACGCQRPPLPVPGMDLSATATAAGSATINYTVTHGYMPVGEKISYSNLTWSQAEAACSAKADCAGFTFNGNDSKPATPVPIRLKMCSGAYRNPSAGWWSWTKPVSAMPVPIMPASCAMFCQNGQSCDPCHPDDDGYDLLARKVFDWVVAHK